MTIRGFIRRPAVAGQFYPADPEKLRLEVRKYISLAEIRPVPDRVCALLVPHAGYAFSGKTAGYAYARVKGKKCARAILLGVAHYTRFNGYAVPRRGVYATPVGDFPIDEQFVQSCKGISGSEFAHYHAREHCLEVQLPFLAEAIGVVPIVPILLSGGVSQDHVLLGKTLAEQGSDQDLLIASTDLSHHLSQEQAHVMDSFTIETILSQSWEKLATGLAMGKCAMCGGSAVLAAMSYALRRGADAWLLLDYRTSAEATGEMVQVVGYASISMERRR